MFLPKLQWNSKTRRMGQESDGGKTCWNFLLLSDLQGFSAAITQKCYQMLLAIVGPKKTLYLHKVSLSFKTGKRKCFPHKCLLLLQFMPTQFWNFITYLLSFFFAESLRVGHSLDPRTNRKTWILRKESCSCGYLPTAAAFGFCHLILSLSLDSKLSAISWRKTHFDECTCTVALHTRFCVWLYTLSIACRHRKVSFPSRHTV